MDPNLTMQIAILEQQHRLNKENRHHKADIEPDSARHFLPAEVIRDLLKR